MSWINNAVYPKNKVSETESIKINGILNDIKIVLNQTIKIKVNDKAENAK